MGIIERLKNCQTEEKLYLCIKSSNYEIKDRKDKYNNRSVGRNKGCLQSEFSTFYDYRRTGYPKWKINPASGLNSEAQTKIPMRWRYPSTEYSNNPKHVDAAIASQFGGVDDINQLMWLLK